MFELWTTRGQNEALPTQPLQVVIAPLFGQLTVQNLVGEEGEGCGLFGSLK